MLSSNTISGILASPHVLPGLDVHIEDIGGGEDRNMLGLDGLPY